MSIRSAELGWFGIVRLGIAQMALGSVAVLATSTLNRIMVVELALPAIVPGLLVGLHYGLQALRPRWGYASDRASHPATWIIGGMALLAGGAVAAAFAMMLAAKSLLAGMALAAVAYSGIGIGVGSMGTALLTLLARTVAPARRPAAATIVWLMMIAGSAITASLVGTLLHPFSYGRLVRIVAASADLALAATVLAVWRVAPYAAVREPPPSTARFSVALRDVLADPRSRRFTIFVFVSMLAYGAQELILEPFAGLVFGFAPGRSTQLIGLQHGGVLGGMLVVALIGSRLGGARAWTLAGCIGSAMALLALAGCAIAGLAWPLRGCVVALGLANGAFAVSAIGAMMQIAAARPRAAGAGTAMGLFGAAQAIAFACGGLISSGSSDIARRLLGSPVGAYACVFAAEAALFVYAAWLALGIFEPAMRAVRAPDGLRSMI